MNITFFGRHPRLPIVKLLVILLLAVGMVVSMPFMLIIWGITGHSFVEDGTLHSPWWLFWPSMVGVVVLLVVFI